MNPNYCHDYKKMWEDLKAHCLGKKEHYDPFVEDYEDGKYSAFADVLDTMHNLEIDSEKENGCGPGCSCNPGKILG